MPEVQIVFGCGDLPARYLEFLADALERPVYYVLGNHAEEWRTPSNSDRYYDPMGCQRLDGDVTTDSHTGLIIAGLPGSPRYSGEGGQQFTESQMYAKIARMMPKLIWNRVRHGRSLDVLISHAPARDVNDQPDLAHRGFTSIQWFLRTFKPTYHLHGHIHLYDRNIPSETTYYETRVINVYPYKQLEIDPP